MNAQNRLVRVVEFLILTNSLGWTLKHEGITIESEKIL
jgi:hypothetical protein